MDSARQVQFIDLAVRVNTPGKDTNHSNGFRIFVYVCVGMYVCMYVCVYVCVCVCVCVYMRERERERETERERERETIVVYS